MKTIRNLMTLAGLSALFLALGAAGARAQSIPNPNLAGRFNLPFEAQWGATTLPVGEYSLYYGRLLNGGIPMVEIVGKDKGSPHVFIFPMGTDVPSTTENALVLVRQGSAGVVRSLELPAIGTSVDFALPPNTNFMARNGQHNNYAQLAKGSMLLQRIPVTLSKK